MDNKEIMRLEKEWKTMKTNYNYLLRDIELSGFEIKNGVVVNQNIIDFWIELSVNGFISEDNGIAARYFIKVNNPKFIQRIKTIQQLETYEKQKEEFEKLSDILLFDKTTLIYDETLEEDYVKTFIHLLDILDVNKVDGNNYVSTTDYNNEFCFDRYFTVSDKCYGYITLIKNVKENLAIYNFEEIL